MDRSRNDSSDNLLAQCSKRTQQQPARSKRNINMMAAFSHILGDTLRTVAEFMAALVSTVTGIDGDECDVSHTHPYKYYCIYEIPFVSLCPFCCMYVCMYVTMTKEFQIFNFTHKYHFHLRRRQFYAQDLQLMYVCMYVCRLSLPSWSLSRSSYSAATSSGRSSPQRIAFSARERIRMIRTPMTVVVAVVGAIAAVALESWKRILRRHSSKHRTLRLQPPLTSKQCITVCDSDRYNVLAMCGSSLLCCMGLVERIFRWCVTSL